VARFQSFFCITLVGRQLGITRRHGIHHLVYYQQCESMESAIANRPPRPSFPRRRESSIPPPFLDSRLRGNDGYFDRLVLKKARGHESMA
jgi:hypothetical protein